MKCLINRFGILLYLTAILGVFSCSSEEESPEDQFVEEVDKSFSYAFAREITSATPLRYTLYIFSRQQETEKYRLDSILPVLGASSRLKFSNQDLNERSYRFLFVATPSGTREIEVAHSNPAGVLNKGIAWDQICLRTCTQILSIDNYYDVVDMDGNAILATDSICGHLTRCVGQMVFRFSKIGSSINDIRPIDDPAVTSIFDRVYDIEVKYEGCASGVLFADNGDLVPMDNTGESISETQHIVPVLNTRLGISLPQLPLDMIDGNISNGGLIMGLCLLPVRENVQVAIVFHYYDTTPKCGEVHVHNFDCYDQRFIQLNIPSPTGNLGLSIEADAYTISKAGIRCNRLIDIKTNHGIEINTDWLIN